MTTCTKWLTREGRERRRGEGRRVCADAPSMRGCTEHARIGCTEHARMRMRHPPTTLDDAPPPPSDRSFPISTFLLSSLFTALHRSPPHRPPIAPVEREGGERGERRVGRVVEGGRKGRRHTKEGASERVGWGGKGMEGSPECL